MKREIINLKGLTCGNCAAKIENDVNKLNEVKEAVINIINQTVTINHVGDEEKLFHSVENIVAKYEPDVVVSKKKKTITSKENKTVHSHEEHNHGENAHEGHSHQHSHDHGHGDLDIRKRSIQFAFGIVLFLCAVLVKEPLWLKTSFYLVSYGILGFEVLIRAGKNILKGQIFDENFLMSIATLGAIAIGEMPEAVFVMLFYQIGETFQDLSVNRSRKSIMALMDIRPDYANLIKDEEIIEKKPEEINIGDIILVKAGERIPLDGTIINGKTMLDTSALTGESVPIKANEGSSVMSGSINISGVIRVMVEKEFSESTVMKILELTENAAAKKTKTEQFITKFARVYTPVVVAAAVILAVAPPLIAGEGFAKWLERALIFLVISCPCALVISVPLGFFSGIGEASRKGILIKGSNYLQALCEVNTVVLDKTGTVTEGVFQVSEIKSEKIDNQELLKIAAYAEKLSNHPIAKSIASKFEEENEIETEKIESYEEISGHGVSAVIDGRRVFAGNMRLMEREGIAAEKYKGLGSVVYIAAEGEYLGRIIVSDKIKSESMKAVKNLKALGIKDIVMLTGDNSIQAEAVAKEVGIDKVFGQLLPQNKVEKVEEIYLENENAKILFVGDGINDAPVLSRVEVGVAMGGVGSDAAIEAADVVIMNDNLLKISEGITIAKNTNKVVKENIVFALGVKAVVLVLGAVGLSSMWMAVFADVGVSLIAILNSMRKKI